MPQLCKNKQRMALLSVYDPMQRTDSQALAALRIHGFYSSLEAARLDVLQMAREQADVQSYIVEGCLRWVPVQKPVKGTGLEEDEISAPQNDDPEKGRMGSVCDLRAPRNGPVERKPTEADLSGGPGLFDPGAVLKPKPSRGPEQQKTLDTLLHGLVSPMATVEQYGELRTRMAWLKAFRRKLFKLIQENETKCDDSGYRVMQLNEKHPEYKTTYRQNYERALKESGIPSDSISFMEFLTEEVVGGADSVGAACP